jgi:hypothetical protein
LSGFFMSKKNNLKIITFLFGLYVTNLLHLNIINKEVAATSKYG